MKSSQDIEALLRGAMPKPPRPLSPDFTPKVVQRLTQSEQHTTIQDRPRAIFRMRLAPLALGVALAMCAVTAGTVYAAFNGWPHISALFSGETHQNDGTRVVKVSTANCVSMYVPLAFQYIYRQQGGEVSYYFRIKKGSKLTNEEVVQMVRGYCELGQQTAFDQKTVLPELTKQDSNKNAQIFGLFTSSTVERITNNAITVKAHVPSDNNTVKQVRFSFSTIDPDVLVYDIDHKISLQDIRIGDNVAIKYRVPPSNTSQELGLNKVTTDKKTVVAITKNPPNIAAALDYPKYKDDLIEVTPCNANPSGYCTAEEFAR